METIDSFLAEIKKFLETEVEPIAHLLDQDPVLLKEAYEHLKSFGVLKLHIPTELGGLGGTRTDFVMYNRLLAEYSGALLFLQAQHQYVMRRLKTYLETKKVQDIFKGVVQTDSSYGVFFAIQKKNLSVLKDKQGGFRLSGTLPWITGRGFHSKVFIGFAHEDHKYATHIPFETIEAEGGSIHLSAPKNVSVFESVNTVELTLNNWYIPKDLLLFKEKLTDTKKPSEHPAIYNFSGVASALLKQVTKSNKYELALLKVEHQKLQTQLDQYNQTLEKDLSDPEATRAQGLKLAQECSQLAQLAWGGVGLMTGHPVERLTREMMQYTIAGLSTAQIDQYLKAS